MTTQTPTRTRPDRAPSGYLWAGPECSALIAVAVEFENQYRNRFDYFEPCYGMGNYRMSDPEYVQFVWTELLPKLDGS